MNTIFPVAVLCCTASASIAEVSEAECSQIISTLEVLSTDTKTYENPVVSYSVPTTVEMQSALAMLDWEPLIVSPRNPPRQQFVAFHDLDGDVIEAASCSIPVDGSSSPLTCTYIFVRETDEIRASKNTIKIVVDKLYAADCEAK